MQLKTADLRVRESGSLLFFLFLKKTCNRLRSEGKRQKRGEIAKKNLFHPVVRIFLPWDISTGSFHESLISGKPQGYIWCHIHEDSNDFLALHFQGEFDSFSCENAVILSNLL